MANHYLKELLTPSVRVAQLESYGRGYAVPEGSAPEPLGGREIEFIATRDSFYLATLSESGWPYVQHRGGLPGFLRALSPRVLGFADYKGNRQLLSVGHLKVNNKASLFLMNYAARERLKILGHIRVVQAEEEPELTARLIDPASEKVTERYFLIDVVSYDWNCPKYITPRFTSAEVETYAGPLKQRITELEAELSELKAKTNNEKI